MTDRVLALSRLKGACKTQLSKIKAEWPDGIPLTEEAAARAVEMGLDIDWAADALLTDAARVEWGRARDAARAECVRAKAGALLDLLLLSGVVDIKACCPDGANRGGMRENPR